ncbi:MAG: hypothetical protein H6924_08200 [Alphaproteobacteria bacterium]|nr:hypothetical protein [Alphaproteobacteria bacterium]
MKKTAVHYRGLAYVWGEAGLFEGTNGLRLDKSAAVGSAHVVVFLHLLCQPAYTLCRRHTQGSQQYQGLERRRANAGFRP